MFVALWSHDHSWGNPTVHFTRNHRAQHMDGMFCFSWVFIQGIKKKQYETSLFVDMKEWIKFCRRNAYIKVVFKLLLCRRWEKWRVAPQKLSLGCLANCWPVIILVCSTGLWRSCSDSFFSVCHNHRQVKRCVLLCFLSSHEPLNFLLTFVIVYFNLQNSNLRKI